MKRFISILLAFTMLAGMGFIAYVENQPSDGSERVIGNIDGSASIDVPGAYTAAAEPAAVYRMIRLLPNGREYEQGV